MTDEEVKACALFDIYKDEYESKKNLDRLLNEALKIDDFDSIAKICEIINKNKKFEDEKNWE